MPATWPGSPVFTVTEWFSRYKGQDAGGVQAVFGELEVGAALDPLGISLSRRAVPLILWDVDQWPAAVDLQQYMHSSP